MKSLVTALLFAAILLIANFASAKVITLDCFTINKENNHKYSFGVSMDTEQKLASVTGKAYTGKLFSDGSFYWFTIDIAGYISKYQIDRRDLSVTLSSGTPNANNPTGQCTVVELEQPKI
jgi:hypothetical protein